MNPEVCPCCGAEVPRKAKACPQCGADEKTGWSDDSGGEELGLPDEDFDYEEFVKREFNDEKKNLVPHGIHWFWWGMGILLVAAFVWGMLR
jgi:hypothetical protein